MDLKKTTQQTAQAIVKTVREQTNETLKSATTQIAPTNESAPAPQSAGSVPTPNKAEIEAEDQQKLNIVRARLQEMLSEEKQAVNARKQSYEAWKKAREEQMVEPEQEQEEFVEAQGKPRHSQKGAGAQIHQKQNKSELGRGAKN